MLHHHFSLPTWALTALYSIIALITLLAGLSTLISYLTLKRRRRRSMEGDKVQAVGWRKAITEFIDIRALWATSLAATLVVVISGVLTGSILLMSSLFLLLIILAILMFYPLKDTEGGLSASEKFDYLSSIAILLAVAIPVGVDTYFVYNPQPPATYYQDASGGYHESAQYNMLAGKVVESRKEDGLIEYQWGELSVRGGNVVLPNTGSNKDASNRVEVVEDLPPGEAPYVVRKIDIAKPAGVPVNRRLCLAGRDDAKSSSCTPHHESVDKRNVSVVSSIHIPAGERDKYVTSSLADSSVVGKEKTSNGS